MTRDGFVNRYPEFSTLDPDTISAVLTEVAAELGSSYGTRFDAAQAALTAHRLWLSPAGMPLRGESDQTDTSDYLEAFKKMATASVVVSRPLRGW